MSDESLTLTPAESKQKVIKNSVCSRNRTNWQSQARTGRQWCDRCQDMASPMRSQNRYANDHSVEGVQ
jgi:hypothetical protein